MIKSIIMPNDRSIKKAYELLKSCRVCPRNCKINRLKNEKGTCEAGLKMEISSIGAHHGEEPPISGTKGSGTIFFSHCNLRCIFCQNYQISWEGLGKPISEEELADEMLGLQKIGRHNINLVSPTHYGPQILKTLIIAKEKGLKLPIVYNSNGYDSLEMLKLFDGLIDIYLPDIKYSNDENALKYSGVKDYVKNNRAAISEMFRQVGNLKLDKKGIAKKGIIVRHLILPENLSGSFESLKFLASLSEDIWVSAMAQYNPCFKAVNHPILGRRITKKEYQQVLDWIFELGLNNVMVQELESSNIFLPDFEKDKPFE